MPADAIKDSPLPARPAPGLMLLGLALAACLFLGLVSLTAALLHKSREGFIL
jgi:hypothetical protein